MIQLRFIESVYEKTLLRLFNMKQKHGKIHLKDMQIKLVRKKICV